MKTEIEFRRELAKASRMTYEKGFVAATDGNLSIRLPGDILLVTPSGTCKGDVTEEMIIKCDMEGNKIGPGGRVTTEILIHQEIYRQRSDVRAVVHAHPPIAIAFTIAGVSLAQCVIPEVVVTMGSIPTAEYFTPSRPEGQERIRELVKTHDAVMMDRHGSLTMGKDIWEAYRKLEKLEHAAHITYMARQMGNVRTLPADEVERLLNLRGFYGGPETEKDCNACGGCISEEKPVGASR